MFIVGMVIGFGLGTCFGAACMFFEHIDIVKHNGEVLKNNGAAAYNRGFKDGSMICFDDIKRIEEKIDNLENEVLVKIVE